VPLFGAGGPAGVALRPTGSVNSIGGTRPAAAAATGAPSSPSATPTSNGVRLPTATPATVTPSTLAAATPVAVTMPPLVIQPIRTLDSAAVTSLRADVMTLRKQFDDYWLQMEMDITRQRMAVLHAFTELTAEIDRGVMSGTTPIDKIKETITSRIGSGEAVEWRRTATTSMDDIHRSVSDASSSITDARTRATDDAKRLAEEKQKKEYGMYPPLSIIHSQHNNLTQFQRAH
jgi:hypothetical protein